MVSADPSKRTKDSTRQIAVLVETDDTWGRNVVEAIALHARSANWSLLIAPRDSQRRLRLPRRWRGDGVIVSLRDKMTARHVQSAGVAAVDVSSTMSGERWLGRVTTDDVLRARAAFDHFRSRCFEHFGCYAPPDGRYPDARANHFAHVVQEHGLTCETFTRGGRRVDGGWMAEYERVTRWLETLPRPVAIFASDPYPARQLAEICEHNGLRIPDEVALLAGDNDELLCKIAWPRITSIELANHRIGAEACCMLEKLMDGASVNPEPLLIPPHRVIERHSTDVLALHDQEIAEVLLAIREEASYGLDVQDLLRRFPISRRGLELKFRQILGRTPAEEIRRVRLEEAKRLLLETDQSLETIALKSGFSCGSAVSHAFRKYLGVSPGELRSSQRSG